MTLPIHNKNLLKIIKKNRTNTILSSEDKNILKAMKSDELDDTIAYACEEGDLEILTYIFPPKNKTTYLNKNKIIKIGLDTFNHYFQYIRNFIKLNINDGLSIACYNGHLEVVKLLLNESQLKFNNKKLHNALYEACRNNHLDIVKFLFEDSVIKSSLTCETINEENGKHECAYLEIASVTESIDVLNYFIEEKLVHIEEHITNLVTSTLTYRRSDKLIPYFYAHPKTKNYIDTENNNYNLMKRNCEMGNLNMIKFFLETNLKNNISINIHDGELFILAYDCFIRQGDPALVEYLIFEQNITQTSKIMLYINNDSIINMFEKRNLNQKLSGDLTISKTKQKTNKL